MKEMPRAHNLKEMPRVTSLVLLLLSLSFRFSIRYMYYR